MLLLFAFAVAANGTPTGAEVLPHTALAAAGAAFAWLLAVSGRLVHPDRPQRLAVATALRKLAELLDASAVGDVPGRTRHAATVAVLHAYYCLGLPPPTPTRRAAAGRDAVFVRLTDLSWTLLIGSVRRPPGDPVATARHLRRQARLLTDRRRRVPPALTEPLHQYEAPTPSAKVRNAGTPLRPRRPLRRERPRRRAIPLCCARRHC
ncbi:hypothetical protein ACFQ51_49160 [Streptomyces kaempferi]